MPTVCRSFVRSTAIVGVVFCRQADVIEIGHTARDNRQGNRKIAAPCCLPGIGSIVEESEVILYGLQREHVPAEMRGLRDPAHAVKAELYVRAFVVVEQAS